jgi:hypothetical protein
VNKEDRARTNATGKRRIRRIQKDKLNIHMAVVIIVGVIVLLFPL